MEQQFDAGKAAAMTGNAQQDNEAAEMQQDGITFCDAVLLICLRSLARTTIRE